MELHGVHHTLISRIRHLYTNSAAIVRVGTATKRTKNDYMLPADHDRTQEHRTLRHTDARALAESSTKAAIGTRTARTATRGNVATQAGTRLVKHPGRAPQTSACAINRAPSSCRSPTVMP